MKYKNHNCYEIRKRFNEVCQRANMIASMQESTATTDALAISSGVISLWFPVLFLSGGGRNTELAILKGEVVALEQNAIEKNCTDVITILQEQRKYAATNQSNIANDALE